MYDLENLESTFNVKPKMVISFDDGYADFVDYALPILDELNIPSNQNIIPYCVESGEPPWNVKIYDFLHQAPLSLVHDVKIPGFTEKLNNENFRAKALFGLAITKYLNNFPKSIRQELLLFLSDLMLKLDNFNPTSMMTIDDCRSLSKSVTLGVHSYAHDAMGLESDAFFQDDFNKCVGFYTTHKLGKLDIYAFPYGSHRTEQIEFLLSKSVQKILLVEEKYAQTHKHIYPRFTMYGTSSKEVACRAMGLNAKGAL
jgi:peptidoglycan/xylan/chitin deacetylase (PgdA/CDA1 family)